MKVKKYYGKQLNQAKLEKYNHNYLPDDYESPCYVFAFNDDDCIEAGRGQGHYYIEVFINEKNEIMKIERYREVYMCPFGCNYSRKIMCASAEDEAEKLLDDLTGDKLGNSLINTAKKPNQIYSPKNDEVSKEEYTESSSGSLDEIITGLLNDTGEYAIPELPIAIQENHYVINEKQLKNILHILKSLEGGIPWVQIAHMILPAIDYFNDPNLRTAVLKYILNCEVEAANSGPFSGYISPQLYQLRSDVLKLLETNNSEVKDLTELTF